jgi:hypothetical protein
MDRDALNALPCEAPDLQDERRHFYRCSGCRQAVDKRKLGDVLHHAEPGHKPLPLNA